MPARLPIAFTGYRLDLSSRFMKNSTETAQDMPLVAFEELLL
jgi:hypothetical protein